MILLSDIIDTLISADGSQQATLVDIDGGGFNKAKLNKLISLLNACLADIHKRFFVHNTQIAIQTKDNITDYKLTPENVYTGNNPNGFIISNLEKPVYSISAVTTTLGIKLNFNSDSHQDFTKLSYNSELYSKIPAERNPDRYIALGYNTLRVPPNLAASEIVVIVRTGHALIKAVKENDLDSFNLSTVEVDLPYTYINAICYYILHRLANARGAETIGRGIFHEGNNYNQKYEAECTSLVMAGSEVTPNVDMNNNIRRLGFI